MKAWQLPVVAVVPAVPVPSLDDVARIACDAMQSSRSRVIYEGNLKTFLRWYQQQGEPLSRRLVQAYKVSLLERGLAPATVNIHFAAIRKLVREAQENGYLSHEVAAAIERIPACASTGAACGIWLSADQISRMLALPDAATVRGRRDRAIFALLVGGWLRREEATLVTADMLQEREGRAVIVDMRRKGARIQTVALPEWAARWLREWIAELPTPRSTSMNRVLRGVYAHAICTPSLSGAQVNHIIKAYGVQIGVTGLNSHDLRKSGARLSIKGGATLFQVQSQLGHKNLQTTEIYLGKMADLSDAGCDYVLFPVPE